ncbi:LacI family DNA-binding transcriptional regulator [Pseudonocardia humida]|uniref:LacI family DNA-binding transcriptional regulator n=1 Tax=Pseudonocardia humida TaxID=2800819 RepID=A0ABT0ZTD1_9PSEU|nr:LacI family DNA-binding transcriptional regulator [Pseudonocardia humida]MCO1653977.1 LacI family DNA-binding transcriptional regulator [Pseudonocardia humida]
MTLKTVADRVGVSAMTVSNAFSRPDQLSAALRERILAVAAELGYVGPDPAARTLARGATGTVGILLTESPQHAFYDEYTIAFLAAITGELARAGLALTLLPSGRAGGVIPARDVAMDGAIAYSCRPGVDGVDWLRKRRLPLVFVDQQPERDHTSINVDDRAAAAAAARHVVDLGHRRVALVTVGRDAPDPREAPSDYMVARQRMRGWLDVLEPAGIEPVVRRSEYDSPEAGAEALRDLLDGPDRPTAVLCFSDALAAAVVRVAEDAGLRVPADLSVVGFDDTPLARRMRPALTTVHQDAAEKGRLAAAELAAAVARHRAGEEPVVRRLELPTELVVRESTAPPPA